MLVFPSNPDAGDVFAPGPGFPSWIWDGEKWTRGSTGAFTLGSLADVEFMLPLTDGETPMWSDAAQKWVNTKLSLTSLADVGFSQSLADGEVLTWNASAQKWTNAALPTPITPTLAGLSDVAVSATPQDSEVLTFNAATNNWQNGGAIWVAPRAGEGGAVYAGDIGADQMAFLALRTAPGVFVYGRDSSNAQQFVIEDIPQFVRFNVDNASSGMLLATNGGSRLLIRPTGEVEVNPYNQSNNGTALWVNGPTGTGQWAQVIQGGDGAQGFWVRAGNSSSNYCALFRDQTATRTYFQLLGDGSGYLGPSGYGMSWNATGTFSIQSPPGVPTLQVTLPSGALMNNKIYVAQFLSPSWLDGSGVLIVAGNTGGQGYQWNNVTSGGNVLTCAANSTYDGQRRDIFVVDQSGYIQLPNVAQTTGPVNCRLEPTWGTFISMTTSVQRNKREIHDVDREHAKDIVRGLRPITYRSKCEKDNQKATYYGLIAEEVAEVAPNLVDYDDEGQPRSVHYDRIAMLMLPLLQEWLEDQC